MAFCSKCGAQVDEGDLFCSKCGTKIGAISTHSEPVLSKPYSKREEIAETRHNELLGLFLAFLGIGGLMASIVLIRMTRTKSDLFTVTTSHPYVGWGVGLGFIGFAVAIGGCVAAYYYYSKRKRLLNELKHSEKGR